MAAEVDEFLRDLAREFRPRADQLARDLIQAARAEVPDEWTHAPLAAQEPATTISSPPIDCYVLDDVTEADFADIICERPCTDPNCGCDGCSDERYRVRDAFNQSSQPLLAESVVFDHLGRPMFWDQLAPFEHPDDADRLCYGIDMTYSVMYSHQDAQSFWAYSDTRVPAVELYESLVRSPGIAKFPGWDESDLPGAPLRQAGRYTPRGGSDSGPALKMVRS
ncbi:hypothetical protein ADK57_32215 [Streptomyces sp. MMG1533]|uniref:hypothetical protein n=1 Tax=Streptomyces sp. MMG1533 TaxID=1415546 RepID=UPI0006AEB768|nr:hypothetical protein [Streptomyces sp. MMG1533]KOU59795.1 hypothetical protein ADK57_32215 [Streptomyces sp. MMG1533]